jgi:O-methyltransferase
VSRGRGLQAPGRRVPRRLKIAARRWLARRGYLLARSPYPVDLDALERTGELYPVDFDPKWVETIERVAPYTQTSAERLAALCAATEHVVAAGIPGAIVECGVWRGGSMMAAALTLQRLEGDDRELYLFDTFAGMTRPGEADRDYTGASVMPGWLHYQRDARDPAAVALEQVRDALLSTGYDPGRLHFVEGPVEETVPASAPSQIALLRLDTDWYESTRHELLHLYPRLEAGGVLIIDDYGHFQGARRATDEFFAGHPLLLARVDYTGRMAVKPGRT